MKIFPPVSVTGIDTAGCHGGNEYRGQGAWKRPRGNKNRPRPSASEPLDLATVLGGGWQSNHNGDRCHQRKISTYGWSEQKSRCCRVVATQKKLKPQSLCVSPTSGVFPPGGNVCPQGAPYVHTPIAFYSPISSIDAPQARLGRHQQLEQRDSCRNIAEEKIDVSNLGLDHHASQDKPAEGTTRGLGSVSLGDQHDRLSNSATKASIGSPKMETPGKRSTQRVILDSSALRIPTTSTKIFIDDKYNAEMLDARAALRKSVRDQAKLGKDMRRLRSQVNLGKLGGLDAVFGRRHENPVALTGRRGRRRREAPGASGFAARRIRKHSSPLHPLLFNSERALQHYELTHMRLEDSTARNFARWEKAERQKLDYSTYYAYAERYGPLSVREFDRIACSPGHAYHVRAFDAARSAQVWWWTVWPPVLRRRKAAALAIQVAFRGFLQRRRWGIILRLRLLWGETRIIAYTFKVWRNSVARTKRVKAFAFWFRNRCKARCFAALFDLSKQRREARQNVLRKRLRQVALGVQLRVFEAWAKYAENSLAVARMHFRSVTRPAFTVWQLTASEIRRYTRLRWACTLLASRSLRRQCSGSYRRLKSACVRVQRAVRVMIARARVQRSLSYEWERQAKEVVQLREATIHQDTPRHHKDASIFLRTAAGRQAVASALAGKISENEGKLSLGNPPSGLSAYKFNASGDVVPAVTKVTETEAEDKVTRMFIWREQAAARHDFDAAFPPPTLRCPRPDCDATFVEWAHCVRHGADVHPQDNPEIWTLTAMLSDSPCIAIFETYLHDSAVCDGDVGEQNIALNLLELLNVFQEWRMVPSSSDRFEELTQSAWVKSEPWVSSVRGVDQPYVVSESAGEWAIGKWRKPFGARYSPILKREGESAAVLERDHCRKRAFQVQAIEDASWQVLVALYKSIGGRFLGSKQYESYLDGLARLKNRAIAAAAAEIAERERAEWSAEARSLHQAMALRKQDANTESLAVESTECMLEKTTASAARKGFLGRLVDDQAALLAVIIIAERTAFIRVLSTVWNQAVDEAARLITREQRRLDPRIVEALSDAASTLAQSSVAEALIDQAVFDLTGPDGELWPDARAVAAVADGVAYRIRSDIMDELLEATVYELATVYGLQCSGGSESLVLGHTVYTGHGDEEDGAGGGSSVSSGVGTPREACADDMNIDDLYSKEEPQSSPPLETKTMLSLPSGVFDARVIHAIVMIQSALRRRVAFRETRSLLAQNFTKLYDAQSGLFYWYNQGTGESSREKPTIVDAFFNKNKSSAKTWS